MQRLKYHEIRVYLPERRRGVTLMKMLGLQKHSVGMWLQREPQQTRCFHSCLKVEVDSS